MADHDAAPAQDPAPGRSPHPGRADGDGDRPRGAEAGRVVGDRRRVRPYDAAGVARAVRDLLLAVGEDPDREGLRETPERVARSLAESFSGLHQDPAEVVQTFFDIEHQEMVLVRDIEVYSMCEHHLLPFHGVAHVGYIPDAHGRVTGLSKLARLVDVYAKRPQVQERLTTEVADALVHLLGARGVIVVVEAEHLCMSMRGVRKPGSRTVTSAVRGMMRQGPTRAEAMSLINRH
ncbi:GTP cyclohydrolase I FolE [Pseudactinotalea sp. Z1732]|uniref:GTP cyclohydrolase I FolE n=1 Tax=Micrococcales TaxID=85006 RepID=UPI003C7E2D49